MRREGERRGAGAAQPDVLVVGAGIIGLSIARELAGRGARVSVVERRQPGREASSAAAGMLAPLAEVPEPGPLFDACRASRDLWGPWAAELSEEAGTAVDHDASGTLLVALDESEAEALSALVAAAARLGEATREISAAEARERVPYLAEGIERALLLPGDHRVDNTAVCEALVTAAARRGVEIHDSTVLEGVEVGNGPVRAKLRDGAGSWSLEASALVVAAGSWSGRIPGLPVLPVKPVRGQMLALDGVDLPWPGVLRTGNRYAVRRTTANAVPRRDLRTGAHRLIVGATVEDAGFEVANTAEGLADLVGFVRRRLPGLSHHPVGAVWAGLRPGTPDDLPLVGPLGGRGLERVFLATGHYRHGILLAPWTAARVAEQVLGGDAGDGENPFSPLRFRR